VFVYFGSYGLLAYDFAGKEIWRKPLPIPKTMFSQGSASSPILAEDKLILFIQNDEDSELLAMNPADGRPVWETPLPVYHVSWATPLTWREEGKSLVGVSCAQRFSAFRLADGKEAWWVNGVGFQACSTPVLAGDRVILTAAGVQGDAANVSPPPPFEEAVKKYGGATNEVIAYAAIPETVLFTDRHAAQGRGNMTLKQALSMFGGIKEGDTLDREKWEGIRTALTKFGTGRINQTVVLSVRTGGKEDVTESQVVWKETKGVPEVPSPLVWQGRIYMIRSGGLLVCRDLETGKLIYENRLDSPGGYFASPVEADGRIYLASDQGTVTVVKAGDAGEILARNELKEPIIASPVIVSNTLYVRAAARLWAFGQGTR
jgi:outer membrane protein assembly factor BamB